VFLSEVLHRNQGLQLQKSKTRIMSSSEFTRTNPLLLDVVPQSSVQTAPQTAAQSLFRISLHYDPYSANATEDYERLKAEIRRFPILDIIKTELAKSRVNISVARKLVGTLQYIEDSQLDDAARTLIDNESLLYPIFFNVMSALKTVFPRLSASAQSYILGKVVSLINDGSPVMSVDLNLQYAIRLLSMERTEEAVALITRVFDSTSSAALRRDIILIMTRWREWIWLSDRRASFRSMGPAERRAFIIASYALKDEGKHWRGHTNKEFSEFEKIVRDWIAERFDRPAWDIPL
jgi:hypothetical protein